MEWNNNIAVVDNTVDNNMLPKICYINVCQSKGYNELLGYSILYKQQIKDIKSMTFRDNKLHILINYIEIVKEKNYGNLNCHDLESQKTCYT